MKKVKSILISILLCVLVFLLSTSIAVHGQAPLGINYQGIARNMDGSPRSEKVISIKVSILDGGINGIVEYSEVHQVLTNQFGLFSLVIGQGEHAGSINDVNWSEGNKWLQIEMDTQGGSDFEIIGAQQILSVPYAMYATQSGTGIEAGTGIEVEGNTVINSAPDREVTLLGAGDIVVSGNYPEYIITATDEVEDADSDPTNEIQTLTQAGTEVTLSNGGGTIIVEDADADPANEIQDLSSIESGTDRIINISSGTGTTINVEDLDSDPGNEIQAAQDVVVTPTGNLSSSEVQSALVELQADIDSDGDTDPTNELQDAGDVAVIPSGNLTSSNVQNALEELQGAIDSDGDTDASNEIQDLSNTVSGTDRTINISDGTGTTISVADDDNDSANELITGGSYISSNTIRISDAGGDTDIPVGTLNADLDAGGNKIINLADPVSAQDAVTKNYLDVKDATDYAFKSLINDTGTGSALTFDLSTSDFDEGGLISSTQIVISEPGVYLFNIKGTSTSNSLIVLNVNNLTDYTVGLINVGKYSDTILLKLNLDDILELRANSTVNGEVFTLEFFGYKI